MSDLLLTPEWSFASVKSDIPNHKSQISNKPPSIYEAIYSKNYDLSALAFGSGYPCSQRNGDGTDAKNTDVFYQLFINQRLIAHHLAKLA